MEEAKHAWATLKSVRKLSLLNSNSNNNGNSNKSNSTAIWYDIPAPVIIHCCHEFPDIAKSDNAELIEKRTILAIENEQSTTDIQGNNGLEKYENEETREKRHKNTVELTAVSTVKTDNDGVPKISFSFLHANDNPPRSVLEKSTVMTTVTTTTSTSTIANENGKDESTQDELYDFPRNSYVLDEIESEKVVESEHNCEDEGEIETDGNEIRISQTKFHVESIEVGNVINSPKETCDVSHEEIESSLEKVNNLYVNVRNPNSYDRRKEKKYVRSESDGCDAKFVSISGSYSDPEYSNDTFSNVTRPNGLYPKKHRLGKAWEKMRTWLRDETSRINEIVNKHAKLQAVGALSGGESIAPTVSKSNSASYDLLKAKTRELGSITRIEEFGLSSLSKDDVNSSPEKEVVVSTKTSIGEQVKNNGNGLRKNIATSETVLNEKSETIVPPVSFSMDKLCSDTENDERDNVVTEETESRDHARKQNFTGCIENFYLNATSIIHDLKETEITGENLRYYKVNTLYNCPEPPIIPVTFLTHGSYARLKGYEGVSSLNVSLTFRTYEDKGIILYHQFTSPGYVKLFLEDGKLKIDIQTKGNPQVILDNFDEKFNDGKWHQIILTISKNNLILNVDGTPMRTRRILDMVTGPIYMIGGMIGIESSRGFIGCMRMISIDGNYKLPTDWKEEEYCCKNEIVFDACQMMDRCNPNPCKHFGVCRQNSDEFFCDCANTGYTGAVCHTSLNPLSCEAYKNINSVNQRADIKIDVDGSGPLKPFPVVCEFYTDGRVRTILRHNNERMTPVDGFQEPGSFVQDIIYDADMDQIEALLNRSTNCRQRISYECVHSKLFNSPVPQGDYFRPNSWWVSRNNQKMDYWGGALPGSRKCECGILGNCADPTKWCNCDSDLDGLFEDSGDITEKEYLPVKQLRFGDTGTPVDDKEGRYTLGPLICEGDDLFKNVVTFRIVDASINLPTFDIGHSGDIYFEFKTTIENAVIIHSKGPTDYIKISINSGNQIQFQYLAGSGPLTVSVQTSYRLADNRWHSVSVERNRKEARIVVDGALKNEVREPPGPVRALHLTSEFVVGATTDYRDGYVGCIRALLLNGQLQDLRSYTRQNLYGISEGCMGKCESSPCLNNGTCHERYDGYSCDCRWTAFKGPICADEIGVNMRPSSIIKYDFMGSWRSTISEKIRVGFTTTNPKGFLLGLFSNISGEYMTIMVSNSGHLRVVFDFGFERQEVIFPNKHFGLGQYHDVRVGRKNSGAILVLQVDNYEPKEFSFNIKTSADAQFNNIQYMYIGRNESMTEGFAGCISRVEFDDIYPLKLLFQEDGPGNVRSFGTPLTEDFCGVEPITHPPDIIETRPPPQVDEEKVRAAYNETDTAILGSVLAVIIIALIIMAVLIGRYMSRHKGEYLTQEDKGAEIALDPDSAVVHSATGHQVQKKKEWFI